MSSLFSSQPATIAPLPGITIFRYFWDESTQREALATCRRIAQDAPLFTPRMKKGQVFTQQLTSCGEFGWVADESGYRYQRYHPVTGQP